ncbi:hypothetical protein AMTRI_Chr01g126990 [Amborella trichopoda]
MHQRLHTPPCPPRRCWTTCSTIPPMHTIYQPPFSHPKVLSHHKPHHPSFPILFSSLPVSLHLPLPRGLTPSYTLSTITSTLNACYLVNSPPSSFRSAAMHCMLDLLPLAASSKPLDQTSNEIHAYNKPSLRPLIDLHSEWEAGQIPHHLSQPKSLELEAPVAEKSTESMNAREMGLPLALLGFLADPSYGAPIILSIMVASISPFVTSSPFLFPPPVLSLPHPYFNPFATLLSPSFSTPLFPAFTKDLSLPTTFPSLPPPCLSFHLCLHRPSTLSPPSVAAFTTAPPTCLSSSPSHNHLESVIINLAPTSPKPLPTSLKASTDLHPSSSATLPVLLTLPSPVARSPTDSFDSLLLVDTLGDPISPLSVDSDCQRH